LHMIKHHNLVWKYVDNYIFLNVGDILNY
jgi:hypothetical protein